MNNFDNVTPKKIGNFNVPKNVIECKVDTLTFLEVLLRKNICTWEEIEEIRETVVMHLNVIFPELQLSYSTPAPLNEQAPITPPEQPQKPLYYTPSPTEFETVNQNSPSPEVKQDAPKPQENKPLYYSNAPKVMSSSKPGQSSGIKPLSQQPKPAPQTQQQPTQQPVTQTSTAPANPEIQAEDQTAQQSSQPQQESTNPVIESSNQTPQAPAPQQGMSKPSPSPKPLMPNSGPPKILNAPPRKKM